jgi:hypothetical protein
MTGRGRQRSWPILLASLAIVVSVAAGGGAWAYWRATGTGVGTGTAGTTVPVSLAPGTAGTGLAPSGSAAVQVVVSNPNTSPIHLGSLSLDPGQGTSGFAVDSAHSGCAVGVLSFATQTGDWMVPASSGSTDGKLAIALPASLAMGAGAANACQGASFTVYLAAGP